MEEFETDEEKETRSYNDASLDFEIGSRNSIL